MKKFCYYVVAAIISMVMSSCSATYWSGAAFVGDDMYDTHAYTAPTITPASTTPYATYAAYQRPDSYYQYQYVVEGEDSVVAVKPQYIASTYNTWEEEEVAASNLYISYAYNPWWGYGYDPYYYNYYGWGYPYSYYYGWWHRPPPHYVHRPTAPRRKANIVTRPSASAPSQGTSSSSSKFPSSSSSSSSNRGQSVGTTTSNKFKRTTTTFNSSSSSSSSSSKSSPSAPSSSRSTSSSSSSSSPSSSSSSVKSSR